MIDLFGIKKLKRIVEGYKAQRKKAESITITKEQAKTILNTFEFLDQIHSDEMLVRDYLEGEL